MRGAVLVVALVGCGSHFSPAVVPKLSEMPPDKRGDIISSSLDRPTKEQQPSSKRARKIESYAATAAAIVGLLLSKTKNVGLGFQLVEDPPERRPSHPVDDDTDKKPAKPPIETSDGADLVPWIRLK